jgi:hypothetical protein
MNKLEDYINENFQEARAMDGAREGVVWLCAALCAASVEHSLNR